MNLTQEMKDQLEGLESNLSRSTSAAAAFDSELVRMRDAMTWTNREVSSLASGFSNGLRRAFDGVALDGAKLSDSLKMLGASLSQTAYSTAMRPITKAAGGALADGVNALMAQVFPFAKGGTFSQGQVMPFAKGGIVSSPTTFPMRNGTGLMGEAGPEAIMPLSRGADGKLGVAASGEGRRISVVMNITTPDTQSFQRSQSQIAAQMNRALAQGQRNR